MSRDREALLAVADLIDQIEGDLERLALALACVRGEVRDALNPPAPDAPVSIGFLIHRRERERTR